jgi:NAD(P)-dependent dehydrogenase (short-subunit alcohol dehydrogenase family)
MPGASIGVECSQAGVLNVSMQATLEPINVNGLSAAMVSRTLVPQMGEGSKIVNISSQIGSMVVGAKFDDLPDSTSTAVLNMVTVQLATQLKDQNITVACFHPGWVRTDMGGQSADLSPEESAAGIVSKTDALTLADSGQFFRWDGTVHPW